MKLKITAIREPGNLEKERIVMKALAPINVGDYVLLRTGFFDGSVTNKIHTAFWFPDKDIKENDYVVVYTKNGRDSEKEFKGVLSHFFYIKLTESIWDIPERSAVLMYAPDWQSFNMPNK